MNERIRELHRRVMLWADTPDCPDTVEWDKIPEEYTKKLTELIVRECSEVCKQQSLHYAEHNNKGSAASAAHACSFLVKLHFGVEE